MSRVDGRDRDRADAMKRIEWDPLDTSLLTVLDGVVTVHHANETVAPFDAIDRLDSQPFRAVDARWLADGPLLVIDENGVLRWFRERIVVEEKRHQRKVLSAYLAAGGTRYAVLHRTINYGNQLLVEDMGGASFRPSIELGMSLPSMALSGDGMRFAFAYDTGQPGRGFAVWDLDSREMIDRSWQSQPIDRAARIGLSFDHAGKRLAMALPEDGVPALGVLRVASGDAYPRTRIGGATAVALEYRGNLVAYAHRTPPPGARGRLQFDYLATPAKGPDIVEVLDTQTLEHELPDVVALAFSRDRRRLACLASTGQVEVVPVP
jgi:hypothetical protein